MQNYILNEEIIEVEVNEDQTRKLQIENEKVKRMKILKELPKTGM